MYELATARDLVHHIDPTMYGSFEIDYINLLNMRASDLDRFMEALQEEAKKLDPPIILETLWDPDYRKLTIRWRPKK